MIERDSSNHNTISYNHISYLDVSQYILKEYSPLFKPLSPNQHHDQDFPSQESFQLQPIELDHSQIILTPVTKGLIRQEVQDILDDFILEESNLAESCDTAEPAKRKMERFKPKRSNGIDFFRLESDLDRIIEYEEQQSFASEILISQHSEGQPIPEFDNCYVNSNTFSTVCSVKQKIQVKIVQDSEEQYNTTFDALVVDYSQNIQRFSQNAKLQITKQMKQIQGMEGTEKQKKMLIKKLLEDYLLQTQLFHFQEMWLTLNFSLKQIIALILSGLDEAFSRKIGPISFEQRRVKLLKYLEKKKRRIWRKKVSYDCRKKVADGRLRIKGKFVTREQACEQLGLKTLENLSAQEIKGMLQRKMDEKQLNC